MNSISKQLYRPIIRKSLIIDLLGLAFIYLVPTFAHLTNLPIYFIEPMRLMLVLAMVHTNKQNAYIIALSLPLFSFIISSHPVFIKMILISMELALNVFLFYSLKKWFSKVFPAIFLSIVLSKLVYYAAKFSIISFGLLESSLISTPLLIQLISTTVFSAYLYLLFNKTSKNA